MERNEFLEANEFWDLYRNIKNLISFFTLWQGYNVLTPRQNRYSTQINLQSKSSGGILREVLK